MSNKISLTRIKQIIREELVAEGEHVVDHEGVKLVVTCAANLLKALSAFESKATESQKSGLPQITDIKKTLETMINGPTAYVDVSQKGPKTVVFSKPKNVDNIVNDSKK